MTLNTVIGGLSAAVLGDSRAQDMLCALHIDPALASDGDVAGRAHVAMALNVCLLADLMERVPSAAAYRDYVRSQDGQMLFDHGALRTIDGPTGKLPRSHEALARVLRPLGYGIAGTYPLPRLNMTGLAFCHRDFPEDVPQFFVSALHVDQLEQEAQAAAERVFATSHDPLGKAEWDLLEALERDGTCPMDLARAGLPGLVAAFGCHHETPALADYETLLAHSAEAAWIATEGNAFNHGTDRVADVVALAQALREAGLPMKDEVEVSQNGRVRQTATIADKVRRRFISSEGDIEEVDVPGSFYEFISRDTLPGNRALDLSFDSGNATGIFSVTRAA